MNVGIFTDCYSPQINGVVTSVLLLKEELTNRGHHVTIITVKTKDYEIEDDVIRISSIPFSKWKEFRVGLPIFLSDFRKIKRLNLDVIHTHTEFSIGLLGKAMARMLKIPILHTYHTMYENYTHYFSRAKHGKGVVKKIIRSGSRMYVKRCNAVIAPSLKTKNALESYGVKNPIYIMPTGIKLKQFHHIKRTDPKIIALKASLNIDPDDKIVLSLGRISEEKSIDVIIRQMPALLQVIPNVKLVIVGDGPYKNKLMKMTDELKLNASVIFVGSIPWDDISNYYCMGDAFVSASKTETQGLTIIEAMASEIPVVIYDDENIRGIIMDDFSGKLFKTEEDLTRRLLEVLTDPIHSGEMIGNALKIVQSLSSEKYGENAEQIYIDLLKSKAFVAL